MELDLEAKLDEEFSVDEKMFSSRARELLHNTKSLVQVMTTAKELLEMDDSILESQMVLLGMVSQKLSRETDNWRDYLVKREQGPETVDKRIPKKWKDSADYAGQVIGHLHGVYSGSGAEVPLSLAVDAYEKFRGSVKSFQRDMSGRLSERTNVDLVEALAEVHKLEKAAREGRGMEFPELRVDVETGEFCIEANPAAVYEILSNVWRNAADSIDGAGRAENGYIFTSMRRNYLQEGNSKGLPKGSYVHLSIQDCGAGFDKEIGDSIFERGFSTKGDKGEGMGLHSVQRLVGEHNGYIDVRSGGAGKGAQVDIWLPKKRCGGC